MSKKLIFLENKLQAEEFIKNGLKYSKFLPISFSFEVEKILEKLNINFKKDEYYEEEIYPNDLSSEAMKETWEIIKKTNLEYRDIHVLDLFYYDIYLILVNSKKYSLLFRRIIELEKPSEIVIFNSNSSLEKENIFLLAKENYDGKIRVVNCDGEITSKKSESFVLSFISRLQKIITLLRINCFKNKNFIFTSGGKQYFMDIIQELSKDKKNKIIDFSDRLRKSFFIGKIYAPFYEFSGWESTLQKEFEEDFLKFKREFDSSNIFEKERQRYIRENISSLFDSKIKNLLPKLEEAYNLFKKKKITSILFCEDGAPLSRGLIELANQFDIKTYIFQHGLMMYGVGTFTSVDYYFVFGNVSKKAMEKNCSKKTKVVSVGCPRYSSFKCSFAKRRKEIVYAMEITNERVMMPDTHLTRKRQRELLKKLFNVMKKIPDYKLILKIRPNWELKEIISLVAKTEEFENYEIIEKTDNTKLLSEAAIVVVNNSTMGVEAILLGTPLISFSYPDLDKVNSYKKFPGVKVVYTEKELESEIKKKLKFFSGLSKKEISNHIIFDGKTNKKVLEIIKKDLIK
jgi:hypothetical protein